MGYAIEYYEPLDNGWHRVAIEASPATAMALIAYLRQDDPKLPMRVVRVAK